jgi:DNA topoisomerase-6 subunit B
MDNQPVSVLVNVSSVYIPYSGVGKEAIAQEEEIIEEIKLAVMDAARGVQRYISGKQQINYDKSRYRTVMKYTSQLAKDLSALTGVPQDKIQEDLERIVAKHYPKVEALKEDKEAEQ